ncbi:MAG: class I SAM-dependent methyltransferase [Clostridiales bacterium]|jgi:23S rRNA (cytosine1962-C5)-methyltransferase|nr:class I SAM-dependent methyltransferase [Clostridiales bacterium]
MTVTDFTEYEILAAGGGEKLERWGEVFLLRPDPQAIWPAPRALAEDPRLHAHYLRESTGGGRWRTLKRHEPAWTVRYRDLAFKIAPMGFKHTGLFPEQAVNWNRMRALVKTRDTPVRVLNLFGYTGAASAALAKEGARVTHVDAAKGMVERCKENAALSGCPADGIRYIVDDCKKFVERELRRGNTYDAALMDPPGYGRGPGGELWKLEDSLYELAALTARLLRDPLFYLINSYTTGLQPTVIETVLRLVMAGRGGRVESGELALPITENEILLPAGCSGLWVER